MQELFYLEKKLRRYNASPLPFQGQKRYFIKQFIDVLNEFPYNGTYVDLFGGSGLLSHTIKRKYPESRVIFNDFDNFSERIKNIKNTNFLLNKIREIIPTNLKEKYPLSENHKDNIIEVIKNYEGYIDVKTVSKSLFYGGTYAENIDDIFNYKTFYNCIKKTDYNADEYLNGLEIVSKDYRELIEDFYDEENVIFVYDPPYLTTNSESYNSVFHWKLNDYLDIVDSLKGKKMFIYFTSHKGGLLELLKWMDEKYKIENPLKNAKKISVKTSAINSVYTDFMFYKNK